MYSGQECYALTNFRCLLVAKNCKAKYFIDISKAKFHRMLNGRGHSDTNSETFQFKCQDFSKKVGF